MHAVLSRRSVRCFSAPAAAPAAKTAAAADPAHEAWLQTYVSSLWPSAHSLSAPTSPKLRACRVTKYPVVIPNFEWTLEWVLPTPVPLHQFEQSPVVIEVKDRHPDADALVFSVRSVTHFWFRASFVTCGPSHTRFLSHFTFSYDCRAPMSWVDTCTQSRERLCLRRSMRSLSLRLRRSTPRLLATAATTTKEF
jgi:hypothetical protein